MQISLNLCSKHQTHFLKHAYEQIEYLVKYHDVRCLAYRGERLMISDNRFGLNINSRLQSLNFILLIYNR